MRLASHSSIIHFYGVTKLKGEKKYSLVLEYADGGTLRNYLRNNTITFEWKDQLKFAKEIANAILWLHYDRGIVHGDLHPNNILIHKDAIKISDFGRSFEIEKDRYNTEICGVMPYVDPKTFGRETPYKMNEKSDVYCLGFLFWELTSRTPSFYGLVNDVIALKIRRGEREEPVPGTNEKFVELYKKCWEYEPNERPDITEVDKKLCSIDSKNNNNVSAVSEKSEENGKTEDLCLPDPDE